MNIHFPTTHHSFTLRITLTTQRPETIIINAKDPQKKDTWYYRRKFTVNGERVVDLKFPISPNNLIISVYNETNGNLPEGSDPTFKIEGIKVVPLRVCEVWWDEKTREFYDFAVQFAENASILSTGRTGGSLYKSDKGNFQIAYYDVIRDKKSGSTLSTPARVGHKTGIVEASKDAFRTYTVPARVIILLHEFSHKYKNPQIGRPISDESAADINALYIYLGMGWSEIEAIRGFLAVFGTARTKLNHKRYKIIQDFIDRYNKGQIEKCRTKNVA